VIKLAREEVRRAVRRALAEDIGGGDVTTLATVPVGARARAQLVAREPLVVAGLAFAEAAFRLMPGRLVCQRHARDGQGVGAGVVLLSLRGRARSLLTAERVALNFLQRLSGIATLTARFVAAVAGTRARILDTRKTTPGWRRFEKYAVLRGGGVNHRMGLHDMALIKDNHLVVLRRERPNAVAAGLDRIRVRYPKVQIAVETDTLTQVRQAVAAGADWILLDNMPPRTLRRAVACVNGAARTEASGGVSLRTVRAIAQTGVDFISVGALTHSAPAVDIALDFGPGAA
jgi:nicotinate-nucleotide pyrophosphorylase (carboxylating)